MLPTLSKWIFIGLEAFSIRINRMEFEQTGYFEWMTEFEWNGRWKEKHRNSRWFDKLMKILRQNTPIPQTCLTIAIESAQSMFYPKAVLVQFPIQLTLSYDSVQIVGNSTWDRRKDVYFLFYAIVFCVELCVVHVHYRDANLIFPITIKLFLFRSVRFFAHNFPFVFVGFAIVK